MFKIHRAALVAVCLSLLTAACTTSAGNIDGPVAQETVETAVVTARTGPTATAATSPASSEPPQTTSPEPTAAPSVAASQAAETGTPPPTAASPPSTPTPNSVEPTATAVPSAAETPKPAEPEYEIVTIIPYDAIPAILHPEFISVAEADEQLESDSLVLGLSINGDHRAYSIPTLSSYEIVNDTVGGKPVAVTW